MTLSRSNTPLGEKRDLHESVQELDCLLEDLKNAQVSDERSHTRRLDQQSNFYNSSSSLNVPGGSSGRPKSASSPAPLRKLASSNAQALRDANADQVDAYTLRLESELSRASDAAGDAGPMPRGVFVKDVVEEEILVDHVLVPKQQSSDKKFVTRPSERRPSERAKRQVAFGGSQLDTCDPQQQQQQQQRNTTTTQTTTTTTTTRAGGQRGRAGQDEDEEEEFYDNTDTECESPATRRRLGGALQQKHLAHTATGGGSMQSLNSAMTDHSDASSSILDPSKIINCYVCGERVIGQVITALGRNYHPEHFTCAHCHQELGTRNFYERDNLPYCERDYQQLFSPKCAACQEPILDKVTIALEKTFHPEHFVCAHCGCQFDVDDGFHEKDGKPYCKNDFFELFANKCAGCQLPITANYITALGVQWHPDCFVCSDCHCPFGDGKFFDIEGLPYCEIHYHARRGSLCAVCREPIIGKCTTAMFRKFHPDHFTCTYCVKVLSREFKEENDKPYCFECFDKLYS